jgi:hypothetical protein
MEKKISNRSKDEIVEDLTRVRRSSTKTRSIPPRNASDTDRVQRYKSFVHLAAGGNEFLSDEERMPS